MDILQFPLIILLIAYSLNSLGSFIISPSLAKVVNVADSTLLYSVASLLQNFSTEIIMHFPLILMMRVLYRKNEGTAAALIGFFGYFLFNVVTTYFGAAHVLDYQRFSVLGIHHSATINGAPVVLYPIQTGVIGALVVGYLTHLAMRQARKRSKYGFLPYIDRDTWCTALTLIGCAILGLVFSYIWPFVIKTGTSVLQFIAYDTGNPVSLFLYGILDRVLGLLNLSPLIRNPFWFGDMGGSWLNSSNVNFYGDVNIWVAQVKEGLFTSGAGKLITPYYLLNLFALPAIITMIYTNITDAIERSKFLSLLIITILLSYSGAILLPIEWMLLLLMPTYYIFHLFMTGLLFSACHLLRIWISFNFTGDTAVASPGGIFDLFLNVRTPVVQDMLILLAIVGVVVFVIYFIVGRIFYYRLWALDGLQTGKGTRQVNAFVEAMGGIRNIRLISSSIIKVIVYVHDPMLVDFDKVRFSGAYKLVETRTGFSVYYGSSSRMIRDRVEKMAKQEESAMMVL
jgi:phosphotransferase system  glucose/maltose/N-acetylglucosamine-specific IIC component/phosphotransferase system IIB component